MSARARRDLVLLALVATGVMAAYLAVQRGEIDVWDGKAMASVAQNLSQHRSLEECCRAFGAFPKDPGPYAKFGIGYSLVLAPLWHFQLGSNPDGALWLGLANPLLLTATTVVIVKTGILLGWRRSSAVLSGLAFALLTMAPLYSTEFFSEPGVAFGSSLLILGFVVWDERRTNGALLVGIGTAIAILFRPDSIILIGPIVPLLLLFRGRDEIVASLRSWLPRLGIPIGLALGWTAFYDSLRYGSPFQLGYSGVYDVLGFSTPLLRGVSMLVLSPGKSFFVYSPILLAAIPGLAFLSRRRAPLAVVITAMFVLRVAFYARWWTPEGGNSWGPRFLLPLCAALAIPLGEALERVHLLRGGARHTAVWSLGALVGASIAVELASLLVSYRDIFAGQANLTALSPAVQRAVFTREEHRYAWTVARNPVLWNLRHLDSTHLPSPLYWFRDGATVFGLAMLAFAAIACAGAVAIAVFSDRISR